MKILNKMKFILALLLIVVMQFMFIPLPKAYAYANPATVPLGTVSNFAALGHTTITDDVGPTVLNNGDLGVDSSGTCTGFPSPCTGTATNGAINGGAIHLDAVALTGQTDATAAVTNIGGRGTADMTIADGQLGGLTLTQGVYDVPADQTANLTGDLTLNGDANSVFIFHLTSTLVTATGSRVLLGPGVQACNVFWKVDSSATFNGTTQFVGTVLASASVTFPGGGATLDGRVVAQTAEITFLNTTVNNSSCAAPTPTPAAPTPTPAGDNLSDHGSSCPSCTQAPQSSSNTSGASTGSTGGQVLGASTNTLGATGSNYQLAQMLIAISAALFVFLLGQAYMRKNETS